MACVDADALFAILEGHLVKKLAGKQNDAAARYLSQCIIENPARGSLNQHLERSGLSRRRLEQRFIAATGLPMGMFMRKARFQKAIHLLGKRGSDLNLTHIGLSAGFYDQAHFINEFKAFSGLSPGEFKATELNNFMKTLMMVG